MLTILELGGAEAARLDGLSTLLESLGADATTKWIVVQPDRGSWAEARGRELLIEHVEAPSWSMYTPEQALVRAGRLLELASLHRPAAILCHSPLLLPIVARVTSMVLEPRPVVICTWVDAGGRAWAERGLGRLDRRLAERGGRAWSWWTEQGLASFDALFVTSRRAADQLRRRGLERLYYVPRGADLARFHPREPGHAGASKREPVFIEAPAGVEVSLLRRVWTKLRMSLPRDAGAVVHGPPSAGLDRFIERRRGLVRCPRDVEARAAALAAADVALVLPGFDDGRSAVAEAMASGCVVVSAGPGAELVEAAQCGRVLGLDALTGDALAAAVISWLEDEVLAEAQARARLGAEAELEMGLCLARELTCIRDVVERTRAGVGVPPGLRELEPSVGMFGTEATPLTEFAAASTETDEDHEREPGES